MFASFTRGLEIDRINNEHGYFPENCRWATHKQNSRNRRGVKLSEELADAIRLDYTKGAGNQYQLAEKYGVTQATINAVVRKKIWV